MGPGYRRHPADTLARQSTSPLPSRLVRAGKDRQLRRAIAQEDGMFNMMRSCVTLAAVAGIAAMVSGTANAAEDGRHLGAVGSGLY